jgi:hypothetical protein
VTKEIKESALSKAAVRCENMGGCYILKAANLN